MQFWPAAQNAPETQEATASSEVGVVHDDDRGVAAQVHGELLQAGRAGDGLAGGEPAGEGHHAHVGGGHDRGADVGIAVDDGDDLLGQAGLDEGVDQAQRGQRRQRGRFEDDRVAAGDGRAELVGDQVERVVERGDGGDDAQRFAGEPALPVLRALIGVEGDDLAGVAPCLGRGQGQGVDRAGDFLAGLGDGLAGLADDQLGEGLGAPLDQAGGAFQDRSPGGAGQRGRGAAPAPGLLQDAADGACVDGEAPRR